MGDLAQIFALCYARLKPDGLMVFNLEISHQGDYALTDSGRFAHHRDYIERLLREHRFHVKTMTITPMRLQNHLPVNGYLYVLKRQA
jgi:predicted TPR repeat methyltransferase